MADVVGRLFREFAITLAVSILISLVVSLTLTPMMSARLLRHMHAHEQGWFYRKSGAVLDSLIQAYGRQLQWVLRHQPLTLLVAVATLALTVVLYVAVPKGFFPVQDTGAIQAITEAPQSVSFEAMVERQQAAARAMLAEPDVTGLSSFIGVDGSNTTLNSGRMLITLAPHDRRTRTATEIIATLRTRLHDVPGITVYLQPVQDLTIEDRVSRTQFQFIMEDPDATRLSEWVPKLVDRLRAAPELLDVASDLQDRGLQAFLNVDRDAASRVGVSVSAIDDALYDAFGQRLISTIYTQANQYRVVLEAAPRYQMGPDALGQIHVASADGGRAPPASRSPLDRLRPDSALEHRVCRGAVHAARHQPLGPVPGGDAVVQPRPERVARRGRRRHREGAARARHARKHPDALPGRGRGVPRLARQHAAAHPGGNRHDVHRARRALRELRPPDHHSVDAAVGGCRRTARAAADGAAT